MCHINAESAWWNNKVGVLSADTVEWDQYISVFSKLPTFDFVCKLVFHRQRTDHSYDLSTYGRTLAQTGYSYVMCTKTTTLLGVVSLKNAKKNRHSEPLLDDSLNYN